MLFQFRQKNTPGSLQVLMTATLSYKSDNSLRKQHNFCWHLPYFNPSGWFIGVPCHPFETSFVRPSNPIHYVLLDSVWPCFTYHVSPHLIILLSHLHDSSQEAGSLDQPSRSQVFRAIRFWVVDRHSDCGANKNSGRCLTSTLLCEPRLWKMAFPERKENNFHGSHYFWAIEVNNQVFYQGWELLRATFLLLDSWTHVILSRDVSALPNPMAEGFSRPE